MISLTVVMDASTTKNRVGNHGRPVLVPLTATRPAAIHLNSSDFDLVSMPAALTA
jgi:hypothetical protein